MPAPTTPAIQRRRAKAPSASCLSRQVLYRRAGQRALPGLKRRASRRLAVRWRRQLPYSQVNREKEQARRSRPPGAEEPCPSHWLGDRPGRHPGGVRPADGQARLTMPCGAPALHIRTDGPTATAALQSISSRPLVACIGGETWQDKQTSARRTSRRQRAARGGRRAARTDPLHGRSG